MRTLSEGTFGGIATTRKGSSMPESTSRMFVALVLGLSTVGVRGACVKAGILTIRSATLAMIPTRTFMGRVTG